MDKLLEACITHFRTTLSIFITLVIAGIVAYIELPKELQPDIKIPMIHITITYSGISPEDGERLLLRPMEKELRGIENVKEMTSTASEGVATILIEFVAGFDASKALADVREKVDLAGPELPDEADEPIVREISLAMFPVLIVGLSGEVPDRTLLQSARRLRDKIEEIPQVLDVEIAGDREDLLEVLIDPLQFEYYGFSFQEIAPFVATNNKLVTAGTLDSSGGRIPIKVPGLFDSPESIYQIPVKVIDDTVILLKDVTTIRKGFVDPTGYARIYGKPAIALEVKKRVGENIIETIEKVQAIVNEEAESWPAGINISYFQDNSKNIRIMLSDLENNLTSAMVLVMIIIVAALGLRSATLVGIAIPGSFLIGLYVLSLMGLTINIIVLFSLILAVGMLVDGAIIVVEYADRKMVEGMPKDKAYILASQRMAHPIIASTATTLAAFLPLLFWPGVVGEFMSYMPITLIATLTASLLMALIFVPTLGALFGKRNADDEGNTLSQLAAEDELVLEDIKGPLGVYLKVLKRLLLHPIRVFLFTLGVLVCVYVAYGIFGRGVEFFPEVDPDRASISMRVRGDLSVAEIDSMLKEVESRILDMKELSTIYSRSGVSLAGQNTTEDTHGIIYLEFVHWQKRRRANVILEEIIARAKDIPGIKLEINKERAGPPVGKPIRVDLSSRYPELLEPAIEKLVTKFEHTPGLRDVDDSRPVPGIEWRVDVDRGEASRYGANIQLAGDMIQFVTTGLKLDSYRPNDTDDEVDIRIRYPQEYRNLSQLSHIKLPTAKGQIPLTNFIKQSPAQKVGKIDRSDGKRVLNVRADVNDGILVADKVAELAAWIKNEANLDPHIDVEFKGEDEEQRKSQAFLMKAFLVALAIMGIILVTQFNSFYDAFLILTAVIFSTVGVFLGLLITDQPFGIVMNGIGVISLAGIVVNNNIVLIDTFKRIRSSCSDAMEAVLKTCAQRLRPVLLTTVTTVLGLLPMVLAVNIDFFGREVSYGAPSTQWWTQLSVSVAFGLTFATFLTLVLTPSMLILGERISAYISSRFKSK